MALKDTIKLTFPNKKVFAVGATVAKFKYYGNIDHPNLKELNNPLLIVTDVPNMNRIDGIEDLNYKEIVIIDHHPEEDIKANVSWIDINKSSASQMVTELILNTKFKLNEKIANNLFLGIVSDSERFSLKNTSIETFDTVKKLLEVSKIDFTSLFSILYRRPFNEHKFTAFITNHLIIDENKMGYIKISDNDLKEFNVDTATPANLINGYNFIDELLVWVFVTEDIKNNQYKISIRSRGPIVNAIANNYNGGGHKYASGCRLTDMNEVDKLLKDLSDACHEYEENNKL
jgi:phosphoesterase RecJ-like protein